MSFYFIKNQFECSKKVKERKKFFFTQFYNNRKILPKINKYKKNNTLQVQGKIQADKENKRIYLSALKEDGVMTVEMAIAFPLFLFTFLAILFLAQMFMVDQEIHKGMVECARQIAKEEYPEKTILFAKSYWENYVDTEYLNHSWLKDGIKEVNFLGSYYNNQKGEVILKAQYKMKLIVPNFYAMLYKGNYEIHQKVFRGYCPGLEGEEEQWVYVTENQSVYHISRSCSYLQLKIHQTIQVNDYLSGKTSYKPCEFCIKKGMNPKILYITEQGKKYHSTLMCSGLKRTIKRIKKSEVSNLKPCSRCGNKEEK